VNNLCQAGTSRRESSNEPGHMAEQFANLREESITRCEALQRESERPIVALRRGNARGAKGPYHKHVSIKERKADWETSLLRNIRKGSNRNPAFR